MADRDKTPRDLREVSERIRRLQRAQRRGKVRSMMLWIAGGVAAVFSFATSGPYALAASAMLSAGLFLAAYYAQERSDIEAAEDAEELDRIAELLEAEERRRSTGSEPDSGNDQ